MTKTQRAPVIFIGHGSPMNALESNSFTQTLTKLKDLYPHPKAILCISAHWMTEGTWVTHMKKPKTIHDFYGFPQALFDIQYPAPGSPEVAERIAKTVAPPAIHPDDEMWGLDHGTWSVLRHVFPDAKTPVLQLSLYMAKPPDYHYHLGEQLRSLRDEGVLIVGSGNIVHNLRMIQWQPNAPAYDWALEFDLWVKGRLEESDHQALIHQARSTPAGQMSLPTMDHWLPLLYVMGASDANDMLRFEYEEMQNASISMRTLSYVPR